MIAVYILRCADGNFYVGSTKDLERRMQDHASGRGSTFTSSRLPVELVWHQEYERVDEAWGIERKLHGWSRAKKEALIAGRYELLPGLSRKPRRRPDPMAE